MNAKFFIPLLLSLVTMNALLCMKITSESSVTNKFVTSVVMRQNPKVFPINLNNCNLVNTDNFDRVGNVFQTTWTPAIQVDTFWGYICQEYHYEKSDSTHLTYSSLYTGGFKTTKRFGECLFDGPNENKTILFGGNEIDNEQHSCFLGCHQKDRKNSEYICSEPHNLTALALHNDSDRYVLIDNQIRLFDIVKHEESTNGHLDQDSAPTIDPILVGQGALPDGETFKKVFFATASVLCALTRSGTLYKLNHDNNSKKITCEELNAHKQNIKTSALDPKNPENILFLTKDGLVYLNKLQNDSINDQGTLLLENQQKAQKLWFYENKFCLGIPEKDQDKIVLKVDKYSLS